jgi:hypothetical protein
VKSNIYISQRNIAYICVTPGECEWYNNNFIHDVNKTLFFVQSHILLRSETQLLNQFLLVFTINYVSYSLSEARLLPSVQQSLLYLIVVTLPQITSSIYFYLHFQLLLLRFLPIYL